MKIRLIIPICKIVKNKTKKYCQDSEVNKYKRFHILQNSMKYNSEGIDLVVTSNNFIEYNKVTNYFIQNQLNKLKNKKNLLIGIDFPKVRNPYNGIPAKVFYLPTTSNKNYVIDKYIWEVWNSEAKKNKCTLNAFKKQNRVIKIKNKSITILSCGDILSSVHQSGRGLSNTDLYISLAHLNFSNYSINKQKKLSWIQYWKSNESIVLLTQQLTSNKLNNKHFFEDDKYKLVYPEPIFENQEVYFFNNQHKIVNSNPDYIFIDLKV